MTTSNFYDFITTAKLYSMSSALRQIDTFIANNLLAIARDGTLSLLTYEQLLHCLRCGTLNLHEIDIFQVVGCIVRGIYTVCGKKEANSFLWVTFTDTV